MILYPLSVFISAYLLFQVQPMIGKYILPWFGGTPAVWSTVLVFFQILLTGGYAYSNWLIEHLKPKRQLLMHTILLAVSVAIMAISGANWPSPIMPSAAWLPSGITYPVFRIFILLTAALGLPYFLLSTNSPLMQAWFGRSFPGRSPYWLYALSNGGSLLGLLVYPILVEPNLRLHTQGWLWTAAYLLFALLAFTGAWHAIRRDGVQKDMSSAVHAGLNEPPTRHRKRMWIALSAIASMMLLAITNALTQEVAAIPFLWVLPLAIYLITFIIGFSSERWYNRHLFVALLLLASVIFFWLLLDRPELVLIQIATGNFLLFVVCMICNGELYRLRPSPNYLTSFYLMLSIGGALGGMFVDFLAPMIFTNYWELYVCLILVWRLIIALYQKWPKQTQGDQERQISILLFRIALVIVVAFAVFPRAGRFLGMPVGERNFFGVVTVRDIAAADPQQHRFILTHGITVHGMQFVVAARRQEPTAYYAPQSGGALAILGHPAYGHGMRVGVLGEGIGTLAAYGKAGDVYRFYEINPAVADLANGKGGYFSFLSDSHAQVTTVLGDARLSLEKELKESGSQDFDVLVLDTFSSDSIPVHLLTSEAFGLYLQHLANGGIIAAHISNQHLNLLPVICQIAQHLRLSMVAIDSPGDGIGTYASQWVLLARDASSLSGPSIRAAAGSLDACKNKIPLWTDDYSNLFQILK